ncbi:MAG: ROK family protein [Rhodoglobus sp.]
MNSVPDFSRRNMAIALDLGGTKIEAALVDSSGVILEGSRFRQPTGASASSEQLAAGAESVVLQALGSLPDDATLVGVGIGSAGPITAAQGCVSPLNLPGWRDYPLRDQVAALVPDVPVTLRIDGECITLAEHWVGAARNASNLMGMVVSTGIGGGLILGGQVVTGPSGNAGHIGHIEVGGFDDLCLCGGSGCVEAVASGPRTTAWARGQGWQGSSGEDLAASYAAGDPIAVAAVTRSGRAIGQAIASATALLDLDVVTIGGGFSRVTPDLFGFIREAIASRAPFPFVAKVTVVPSGLSNGGPLIGAAALIHRSEVLDQLS